MSVASTRSCSSRSTTPRTAAVVTISAGKTLKRIDAVLPVGGVIRGRVGARSPIRDLCVEAYTTFYNAVLAEVAANGDYRLDGLATGDYTVVFNACAGADDHYTTVTDPNRVPVVATQVTSGVKWTLVVGGSISGTVTCPPRSSR